MNDLAVIHRSLCQSIRERLSEENMTMKELARRSGTSAAHISQLLGQEKPPTLTTLAKIANALGMRIRVTLE